MSNKNTSGLGVKAWLTIAILAIFVVTVAYSTCSERNTSARMRDLAGDVEIQKLTEVVTDNPDDAEMLHYPGFDVYFSNTHHQPYYVAWVLTADHASATEYTRANNFRPDPEVPGSAQLADYRRSGYDRGHMAPSADFRYDREAQEATFFLTNISPQANALNTKAWANLENQCRNWAQRDSAIVVITGPILSDYLTESIGETGVTVPARYFKVVLAPYADPPRAIGFVMPNSYVEGGVQATVMTVDQVEQITGYDFFSYLPDELEDKIEAETNYAKWQRKR